jgi:hypothetical protein
MKLSTIVVVVLVVVWQKRMELLAQRCPLVRKSRAD